MASDIGADIDLESEAGIFSPKAAAIILGKREDILVGQRYVDGFWQWVQGGLAEGENVLDATFRELDEEFGLSPDEVIYLGSREGHLSYAYPQVYRATDANLSVSAFRLLPGATVDTHSFKNKQLPEFRRVQRILLKDLPEIVPPYKRPAAEGAVRALTPLSLAMRDLYRSHPKIPPEDLACMVQQHPFVQAACECGDRLVFAPPGFVGQAKPSVTPWTGPVGVQ